MPHPSHLWSYSCSFDTPCHQHQLGERRESSPFYERVLVEDGRRWGQFLTSTLITTFDVWLTVHLSIFILVVNQFDAQNLFFSKFISCLYMFRAPCAHRQAFNTPIGGRPVHRTDTYRCDDTRGCIIQFWPPDDQHMMLETCRGMK